MVRKTSEELSGAGPVFNRKRFLWKPDSVVNSELEREAELVAYSAVLLFCFCIFSYEIFVASSVVFRNGVTERSFDQIV